MASPKEYMKQLEDLGVTRLEIKANTIIEAKSALTNVRNKQKQIRQIKRRINQGMKEIRADYKDRMASAGSGTSSMLRIFGKRGMAGKVRADAKRSLRKELNTLLAPYESLKLMIDDLLVQLDDAKIQIQDWIEEAKLDDQRVKTPSAKTEQQKFCPECGNKVGIKDKFCRDCGHNLVHFSI